MTVSGRALRARRTRRALNAFREADEAEICQDVMNALEAEFGPRDLPPPPSGDFFYESLSSDHEIDHAAEAAERVRVAAIEGREKRKIEAERERRHAREEAEYQRKKADEELSGSVDISVGRPIDGSAAGVLFNALGSRERRLVR